MSHRYSPLKKKPLLLLVLLFSCLPIKAEEAFSPTEEQLKKMTWEQVAEQLSIDQASLTTLTTFIFEQLIAREKMYCDDNYVLYHSLPLWLTLYIQFQSLLLSRTTQIELALGRGHDIFTSIYSAGNTEHTFDFLCDNSFPGLAALPEKNNFFKYLNAKNAQQPQLDFIFLNLLKSYFPLVWNDHVGQEILCTAASHLVKMAEEAAGESPLKYGTLLQIFIPKKQIVSYVKAIYSYQEKKVTISRKKEEVASFFDETASRFLQTSQKTQLLLRIPKSDFFYAEQSAITFKIFNENSTKINELTDELVLFLLNALLNLTSKKKLHDLHKQFNTKWTPSHWHTRLKQQLDLMEHAQHDSELYYIFKKEQGINLATSSPLLMHELAFLKKALGKSNPPYEQIQKRIEACALPEEVKEDVIKEIDHLKKIGFGQQLENASILNRLEWILSLPWGIYTTDSFDLAATQKILDEDHCGLIKVKERILEFLALQSIKNNGKALILCLVGPPGVGKTSIAQSIAKSLGRKFVRICLGGIYDECEIRGHRRTYAGAMPGRIINALKSAQSANPLILLDEIDKVGMSNHHGNPAAALLEVLDPHQNNSFHDTYIGLPIDLSKVLFIATANDLSKIPLALRDRLEIIEIPGYTFDEKVSIAQHKLLDKVIADSGLADKGMSLSVQTLHTLIKNYTHEAGVRELERCIHRLCAKYARALLETKEQLIFTPENIHLYLGPAQVHPTSRNTENRIGSTHGLAWTAVGGEVLHIEAALMPGNGSLTLTGKLGKVMQESARTALSYAKSHARDYGISPEKFTSYDLHIHIPAGATPKDGPSAGMALLCAIVSAYSGQKIDASYAMTGELTLIGNILPIGGLKEKLLAAEQAGIKNVLIPQANEANYAEVKNLVPSLNVILIKEAHEALNYVLIKNKSLLGIF